MSSSASSSTDVVNSVLDLLQVVDSHLEKDKNNLTFRKQPFYDLIDKINHDASYKRRNEEVMEYFRKVMRSRIHLFRDALRQADEVGQYLERFCSLFELTKVTIQFIAQLFRCLNAFSDSSIFDVSMQFFKREVFEQEKQRLAATILQRMTEPREDEALLVQQAIDHIRYLEKVKPIPKPRESFLCSTLCFTWLRNLKADMIGKKSLWMETTPGALEYLVLAKGYLAEGMSWLEKYDLHAETVFPVRLATLFRAIFLKENMADLFANEVSGCKVLFERNHWDGLNVWYTVFCKVPGAVDLLSQYYYNDLSRRGLPLIATFHEQNKSSEASKTLFLQLIHLHSEQESIVTQTFLANSAVKNTLINAFCAFCNVHLSTECTITLLNNSLDSMLKGEEKQLTEAELEFRLERAVRMIYFLNEKDLFMETYRHQFAKRLLNKRSASDDMEKLTVTKMKRDWGGSYTVKLEGMMNDFQNGKEMTDQFREWCKDREDANVPSAVDLGITYLTSANWPTYIPLSAMTMPMKVQDAMDKFAAFHFAKYTSRKLTWVHSLGTAVVKFRPTGKSGGKFYDMTVTPVQTAVLALFNQRDRWTVEQVMAASQIPEDVVKKVFHSLSSGKYKILLKDAGAAGEYAVNDKFANPAIKFGVAMPSIESKHGDGASQRKVDEERVHAVEAAVVRIMKARKKLSHQDLMAETLRQLVFFQPDPKFVKKRIESLIEREYMERDEDESNVYKYLA